jgi:trehalose synthase
VRFRWDVIKGGENFFAVTKSFHNALHGKAGELTPAMIEIFEETSRGNLSEVRADADVVFVHDPQPAQLVQSRRDAGQRWVWRCHIDVSRPNPSFWGYLRPWIERYDAAVFSSPVFARPLAIRQFLIAPSIDPISEKNRDLDPREIDEVFERFGIDRSRPVLAQISRFDYLKDPVGVIAAYRSVKRRRDCQLILAGGGASDDPEGSRVLDEVREAAAGDPDVHVLLLPPTAHTEINALQRGSTIVIQKSLKEGFGLTVTEALWKGKPVVASAVGGIPLQIKHGITGMLAHTVEGTAQALLLLLSEPGLAAKLGENGREHVRQNFLLTRHIKEYLLLFIALDYPGQSVIPPE